MKILITGCNGQLGSEMRMLAEEHPEHSYVFTDVNELDVCDEIAVKTLVRNEGIEAIVNCAAYTAVEKAEEKENLELCRRLNVLAPRFLAEAAEEVGAWMVQISTDYVFDGKGCRPYTEVDETKPLSVYGRTKLDSECEVCKACRRSIIVRTAWLYSEFGSNFVKTMVRLGTERKELSVVSDQVGTPTYAFDLAQAIFVILGAQPKPGIYHFTDEGVCSWYDFTMAIHRLWGISSCRVIPVNTTEYPQKAERPHYSVLDKTKLKRIYGMDIPHWEESLARCIARMKETN